MYQKPEHLAQAALRLLAKADALRDPSVEIYLCDHLLAATLLANHVYDWHVKASGRTLRDDFDRRYKDFPTINDIANGVKHPFKGNVDIPTATTREIEWEDDDFWNGPHGTPTLLVVDTTGRTRSVEALVRKFCEDYLASSSARKA